MKNAILTEQGNLQITASKTSNAADFDFLLGYHLVHHKKLKQRLAGCSDWFEFEGSHPSMEHLLVR